jgi:predicted DNA-binding transcriptional regulator AlpA
LVIALRDLADRVDGLDVAEALGELEVLRVRLWREATAPVPVVPAAPTAAVSLREVVERSGMSRDWIYKQARANRLPFARRMGRRLTFDAARFAGWLERQRSR